MCQASSRRGVSNPQQITSLPLQSWPYNQPTRLQREPEAFSSFRVREEARVANRFHHGPIQNSPETPNKLENTERPNTYAS